MASQDFTLLVGTKIDDSQILQQLNTISKKTSVTVKVNADTSSLETLKTVTTKSTDAMGNLVTTTEKYNKSGDSMGTVVSSVTQNMTSYTSSTDKASKSTSQLQGYLERTKKVFDFGLSTASLGLLYGAINEAKEAIVDFDSALTEFNKVSSLGEEQLDSYTQSLSEMGEEVARTRTEMLESATEFIKTGASEEDAAQLAQIAEMYRNIADEQISSSDSAALLTSQMKAFNFTADESLHVIDAINEV